MAREIRIKRATINEPAEITIDGELFPWYVAGDGVPIRAEIEQFGVCTIFLPILADRVIFDDRMADGRAATPAHGSRSSDAEIPDAH